MKTANVIEKLKKAPNFIWIILLGLSLVFRDLYAIGEMLISMPEVFEALGQDITEISELMDDMFYMMYITSGIIGILIFELIAYLAYGALKRRKFLKDNITSQEFKFPVRIAFIAGNIIIGLIWLLYFCLPQEALYATQIVTFTINIIALSYAFFIIRYLDYFTTGKLKDTYKVFSQFYAGIYIVLSVLNLINFYRVNDYYIIVNVVIVIIALVFLLISNNLQRTLLIWDKKDLDALNNKNNDEDNSPPKEIFKGFGF